MLQLLGKRGSTTSLPAVVSPKIWYADEAMDLVLGLDAAGDIRAFQLCYGKPWTQKALMWTAGSGAGHFTVDDGEARPTENRTPLLQPGGAFDAAALAVDFMQRAKELNPEITTFVLEKMSQYATTLNSGAAPRGDA